MEADPGPLPPDVRRVVDAAPHPPSLQDPAFHPAVRACADRLVDRMGARDGDPVRVDRRIFREWSEGRAPLAAVLASRLARSRHALFEHPDPFEFAMVFPLYREQVRMLPSMDHPHGENLLRAKVEQLEWLFRGHAASWRLLLVDDGCPERSGETAAEIIRRAHLEPLAEVLFLQRDVTWAPPLRSLNSADESHKGGAVRYGLWWGAVHGADFVAFTDADVSTDLGQTGLLLAPLLEDPSVAAVAASRRHPDSAALKGGARSRRGKLFIYLWKSMLPGLGGITDTQCGFKAFRTERLLEWIDDTEESGFAFDIELLLHVTRARPDALARVPVVWIDSEAESTTEALDPYLDMLKAVAGYQRRFFPDDEWARRHGDFVRGLDPEGFAALLDRIPREIADADPRRFGLDPAATLERLERAVEAGAA